MLKDKNIKQMSVTGTRDMSATEEKQKNVEKTRHIY